MAITYGFFDSINGDRKYSADDISNYFLKLISNGVFGDPTTNLQVTAGSGMTVDVAEGWGFINCKWIHNDGSASLTIDAADQNLDRIDRVVLRLDPSTSARSITLAVKKGTPAASPAAPGLTRVTGGVWELSLAQVAVLAGATSITTANITDERADTSVCGYVTLTVSQSDPEKNIYYCNGTSDNTMLMQYISNWAADPTRTGPIYINGSFGVDGTATTAPDGDAYSFVCAYTGAKPLVLDFSQCEVISARGRSFGYFGGCRVKALSVNFDEATPASASGIKGIAGAGAYIEDCTVYGSIVTTSVTATAYALEDSKLSRSIADLANLGPAYGVTAEGSTVEGCRIKAASTGGSGGAYGIQMADQSRALESTFTGVSEAAGAGGTGGGIYSGCEFTGMGETAGYGFTLSAGAHLTASGCIFRGYAEDSSGDGIGLTGAASAASTVFLTAIICDQVTETGYTQTGSMVFTQCAGTYTGCFYTAQSVPASMVSLGDFTTNRT